MLASIPNSKNVRPCSVAILSPRWSKSPALVKIRLKGFKGMKAVYHLVVELSIQDKPFDVSTIMLNGRNLSLEPPERQKEFYKLLHKYISSSSYSWELNKKVVEITLKGFEDDAEWIALTQAGMDQSSS